MRLLTAAFLRLATLSLLLSLAGCEASDPGDQEEDPTPVQIPTPVASAKPRPAPQDLADLKRRGTLRILVPANIDGNRYLPRNGSPVAEQQQLARAFAKAQGLRPELIPIRRFADMLPALRDGRGDLIAANLTITDARSRHIAFSVPLAEVREQVLVRNGGPAIEKLSDLADRRIMGDPATAFWPRLQALARKYPTLRLLERPAGMDDEAELDELAAGRIDAVVRDSNIAGMYLGYRDDIKLAFNLKGSRQIAWGMRKSASRLRDSLNAFLHLHHPTEPERRWRTADLAEIKRRRVLRVLIRNNAASYFLLRGQLMGFEYEMARAFAKAHKLRLEVVVPPDRERLLEWLVEGRGDIAVGFLEPLDSYKQLGIAFSRPYHYSPQFIVARKDDPLSKAIDLSSRRVSAHVAGQYWPRLEQLQRSGLAFSVVDAPDDEEVEELIGKVADGDLDLTVADGHLVDLEMARGVAVRKALQISDERPHAVAVRQNNPKLLAAVNAFIKKRYKGVLYNVLYKKYFGNPKQVKKLANGRIDGDGKLSPYDKLVEPLAQRYGFDWRLITAQMYQESRFNPKARSFAGAKGLLQVLPRTARSIGIKGNLAKPEIGLHAGIKYLDWVRDRFDRDLPPNRRLWFALAAYNAGAGHVHDARRLAKRKGWDPDRWFEHTEKAMLLLAKSKYARKARHGYVRGSEPVNYVRQIREHFRAYLALRTPRVAAVNPRPGGTPPGWSGTTPGRL